VPTVVCIVILEMILLNERCGFAKQRSLNAVVGISGTCDIVGTYDPYGSYAASVFENRIRSKSAEKLYTG
jgi:hypothetical protein